MAELRQASELSRRPPETLYLPTVATLWPPFCRQLNLDSGFSTGIAEAPAFIAALSVLVRDTAELLHLYLDDSGSYDVDGRSRLGAPVAVSSHDDFTMKPCHRCAVC